MAQPDTDTLDIVSNGIPTQYLYSRSFSPTGTDTQKLDTVVNGIPTEYLYAVDASRNATHTIDGIIISVFITTFTGDGIIRMEQVAEHTADGVILELGTVVALHTVDGLISEFYQNPTFSGTVGDGISKSLNGQRVPIWTNLSRPTGQRGLIGYNSQTGVFEFYDGVGWKTWSIA